MRKLMLAFIFMLQVFLIHAQDLMKFEDFLASVKEFHPKIEQANLVVQNAEQNIRISRGNFDPKIAASWAEKSLDDKNYYSNLNSKLSIPLNFGPELLAAYETNEGEFLNPQLFTPTGGVLSAGISVPLGNGLMYDKNRAQLDKSKIQLDGSSQIRRQSINELTIDAAYAYLYWSIEFEKLSIYRNAVELANERKEYIQTAFDQGDRPMMDTLEAEIYLQKRTINASKQEAQYQQYQTLIGNYIWEENQVSDINFLNSFPEIFSVNWLKLNKDKSYLDKNTLLENHTQVRLLELKYDQLKVEQKLIKEEFKPTLNVRYNPLVGFTNNGSQLNVNNYKLGFDFSMPLYFRKARGRSSQNKIAYYNNDLKLQQTKQNLSLRVEAQNVIELNLAQAYEEVTESILNATILYDLEMDKFALGESSLFVVNQRENSLLDLRLQQIQLKKDMLMNRLNLFKTLQTDLEM